MYSSNSQDYRYGVRQPPPLQQTPRTHPSSASQQNHSQSVGHGSTHANGPGHLQMQHSNGGYEIIPTAPYFDTAESIQRDFDQYMRETGAMAPLSLATHHSAQAIHPYNQQPPVMGNSYATYGDAHAPTRGYHGGQEAKLPPSSFMRPRPPVNEPYAKIGPVAPPGESRTTSKYGMIEDSRVYPSTSAKLANAIIPLGLAGYVVVPQITLSLSSSYSTRIPSIEFMPKGWYPAGIQIEPTGRVSANHIIENSEHKVFSLAPGIREITIKIMWPGYLHHPFDTRIGMKDGNLTRGELLDLVCNAMVNFVETLRKRSALASKEDVKWQIGGYNGLKVTKFFVAGLLHLGGNYFQPEIWVPCPREK